MGFIDRGTFSRLGAKRTFSHIDDGADFEDEKEERLAKAYTKP